MRAIIVGCGRVGAGLAEVLASAGHDVVILDVQTAAFHRLFDDFPGRAVRADGTDEEALRRAGAGEADYFFALTEGDNRNVLAAQLARDVLGVPHVVAKINDPVRAEAYRHLGLGSICRSTMMVESLARFAGIPPGADDVFTVVDVSVAPTAPPSGAAAAATVGPAPTGRATPDEPAGTAAQTAPAREVR